MRTACQIIAAILVGVALTLAFPPKARAQGLTFDCAHFAEQMRGIANFRDTGSDVDKVLSLVKNSSSQPIPDVYWRVIEREIRRLWKEELPADLAAALLYKRCTDQLGDMGRES